MRKVLVLGIALVLLVACGENSNSWPEGDRSTFLQACAEQGLGLGYCECMLEEMQEHFTLRQITGAELGESPMVEESILKCTQ